MRIEEKSDALDKKILALPASDYNRQKLQFSLTIATAVFVVVGFISQFIVLQGITSSTHDVVSSQIPALQSQVKQRDKTISDQQYELNEAIAAIKKLATQVQSLGGSPGQITINPPPNK